MSTSFAEYLAKGLRGASESKGTSGPQSRVGTLDSAVIPRNLHFFEIRALSEHPQLPRKVSRLCSLRGGKPWNPHFLDWLRLNEGHASQTPAFLEIRNHYQHINKGTHYFFGGSWTKL